MHDASFHALAFFPPAGQFLFEMHVNMHILFIDLLHKSNVIRAFVLLVWIVTAAYASNILNKKRHFHFHSP